MAPSQHGAVERYCKAKGLEIIARFEDVGYSGATAERPALSEMIDAARAGTFELVVVAKWDRLARDAMLDGHLRYRLKEYGVRVESATETNGIDPISEMTQTILAAVSRYERHLIAARLANARKLKASRGGYSGGRPQFGTKAENGALVPDAQERQTLGVAQALRRARKSFRAIASELNARGLKPRSGRDWASSSVHVLLTRTVKVRRCQTARNGK